MVKNQEFLQHHPELQAYLQQHQGVREEKRYDQHEDSIGRDSNHSHLASFGKFLGEHSEISEQLSKNPSLAKNQEYLENHPELREYLKANPGVRNDLRQNPTSFIKSAQEFRTDSYGKGVKSTMPETKPPKQQ